MELFIEKQFTPDILQEFARRFAVEVETAPLGDFENYVFKAVTARGESRVLRLTHSSHRSREQVEAELCFINHLADGGVQVGRAFAATSGRMVEGVAVGEDWFWGALFAFAPGAKVRPGQPAWNEQLFFEWGRTIGRMHALTVRYPKTAQRLHWSEERAWVVAATDEDLRENAERVFAEVANLKPDEQSFGLVHSDVHQGNFFYDGQTIHVFDFDDTMYHFFVHDLAIVLYYSFVWRDGLSETEKDREARFQFQHLRRGYESEFQLAEEWYARLPVFLRLRDVLLHAVFNKKLAGKEVPGGWGHYRESIRRRLVANAPVVNVMD